jgi:hypothetical protein
MTRWRKVAGTAVIAVVAPLLTPSVAAADSYIDFGTNQAACKAAARQANQTSNRRSYCYETGPGHYTLYLAG